MIIAIVTDAVYPYSKGGREKRLFEISTRLVALGQEVHIYSMKWWEGPDDRVERGVRLHGIAKFRSQYRGSRRSIRQGVSFGLACLRLITKQFDVIDVDHMPYFPVFSVWLVCKLRRRKLFATWHEALELSEWTGYMGTVPGLVAAGIERVSVRLPDVITANSNHTRSRIAAQLHRSAGICVVPPGADDMAIRRVVALPVSWDVLFIGRLVKDKNVTLLIKAIHLLLERGNSVQCMIIGQGTEESKIRAEIDELGLASCIQMKPFLPDARAVYSLMKSSRVFVLPSLREGFGMVVLEALLCGTPVVTVNAVGNGSKDLVEDGVTGAVVEPEASALAGGIEEWRVRKPDGAAISRLSREHDWQRLAVKQLAIYRS